MYENIYIFVFLLVTSVCVFVLHAVILKSANSITDLNSFFVLFQLN